MTNLIKYPPSILKNTTLETKYPILSKIKEKDILINVIRDRKIDDILND